jgi:hypothetical protein
VVWFYLFDSLVSTLFVFRDNISKRQNVFAKICLLCSDIESCRRKFLECVFIKMIWQDWTTMVHRSDFDCYECVGRSRIKSKKMPHKYDYHYLSQRIDDYKYFPLVNLEDEKCSLLPQLRLICLQVFWQILLRLLRRWRPPCPKHSFK